MVCHCNRQVFSFWNIWPTCLGTGEMKPGGGSLSIGTSLRQVARHGCQESPCIAMGPGQAAVSTRQWLSLATSAAARDTAFRTRQDHILGPCPNEGHHNIYITRVVRVSSLLLQPNPQQRPCYALATDIYVPNMAMVPSETSSITHTFIAWTHA